jgi:hypothetical protein
MPPSKVVHPQQKTAKKNALELVQEFEKVSEPKRVDEFYDRLPAELKESCQRARNRSPGKK